MTLMHGNVYARFAQLIIHLMKSRFVVFFQISQFFRFKFYSHISRGDHNSQIQWHLIPQLQLSRFPECTKTRWFYSTNRVLHQILFVKKKSTGFREGLFDLGLEGEFRSAN